MKISINCQNCGHLNKRIKYIDVQYNISATSTLNTICDDFKLLSIDTTARTNSNVES